MDFHTSLIKIHHASDAGRLRFRDFLAALGKSIRGGRAIMSLNYQKGELFYASTVSADVLPAFESQFYGNFDTFQLIRDSKGVYNYNPERTAVAELRLENGWFFPFKYEESDESNFIANIFRTTENFDVGNDKMGFFVDMTPIDEESSLFYFQAMFSFFLFRIGLAFRFWKYLLNFRIENNWRAEGAKSFKQKLHQPIYRTRVFIAFEAQSIDLAKGKIKAIFNSFSTFRNFPQNEWRLKFHSGVSQNLLAFRAQRNVFSASEISAFFHFAKNPKNETALLKAKSKRLAIPVGTKTLLSERLANNELLPKFDDENLNSLGISNYRSVEVPIGIYDEDRLRHMYVIGKTGVGKSKFLLSLMRRDIESGRGFGLIDPHGDLAEELMMHMNEKRLQDLVIFDPTDEKYPFRFNPLDVDTTESKQILAKGFIDTFRKYFGANWNPKLEHVLRMIFLALLDKENSTLFDVIRALTDKNFRYEMIAASQDDVVRNFWTNEFAGWSAQFNSEAIMPILNKVWQLLSIEMIRNIFAASENRLNLRKIMDEGKILIVKLPKGKLQEEIMGFLGAMIVTKTYQAAMSRQGLPQASRRPFFLYIDEFQNFATDTFAEILSEARKYGLGLTVAHQFLKQIPENLNSALFGNVGTIASFRISSEDAIEMKRYFDPFLDAYDLANLDAREFYCKTMVHGQVKDPMSLRTMYTPDAKVIPQGIEYLYSLSRAKYSRSLEEAAKSSAKQQDVLDAIEAFNEPIV